MQKWISGYVAAQKAALDTIPAGAIADMIEVLRQALIEDRQIFVIGNGGSASNSSHFATDLGKGSSDALGRRFRVLSLTDNAAWITALGNDYSFEDIFVRQLQNYGRSGDVLLGISVSGSSPNVVKAMRWAKDNGLRTLALVGAKRGGMADIAEQVIVVGDTHYGRVEDVQMNICHMFCYAFMENRELGEG
jgi:D-sedoheptulose 7-phosphate isomerase